MLSGDEWKLVERFRCKRGCDPTFLDYLVWEGSDLRVADSIYDDEKNRWLHWVALVCTDCRGIVTHRDIKLRERNALDKLIAMSYGSVEKAIKELDAEATADLERLIEGNGE